MLQWPLLRVGEYFLATTGSGQQMTGRRHPRPEPVIGIRQAHPHGKDEPGPLVRRLDGARRELGLGADALESLGWRAADALRGAMGVFCAISAACWLQFVWAGRR